MSTALVHRLVLVEDSEDDERLSLRAITKTGIPCDVSVQRDGQQALSHLLDVDSPSPDFIVLDYNLPKYNGLEILIRLRQDPRMRIIPIVIYSGTNLGRAMEECYRSGANSCVTKPDDPLEYVEKLARITRYWLTINQDGREPSTRSFRNALPTAMPLSISAAIV